MQYTVLGVSFTLEDEYGNIRDYSSDKVEKLTFRRGMGDMLHTTRPQLIVYLAENAEWELDEELEDDEEEDEDDESE